jgi:hypothetical protein
MRNHKDELGLGRGQVAHRDALDLALDAALAKYVTAMPRPGIEERLVANLRAERGRSRIRLWRRRPTVAAFAALAAVLVVSVLWRSAGPTHRIAVGQSPATVAHSPELRADATNRLGGLVPTHQAELGKRPRPRQVAAKTVFSPRLDRFPSPQPLSEQEKILQSYFSNYPKDAVLVARAWAAAQRRDAEEEVSNDEGMSQED